MAYHFLRKSITEKSICYLSQHLPAALHTSGSIAIRSKISFASGGRVPRPPLGRRGGRAGCGAAGATGAEAREAGKARVGRRNGGEARLGRPGGAELGRGRSERTVGHADELAGSVTTAKGGKGGGKKLTPEPRCLYSTVKGLCLR